MCARQKVINWPIFIIANVISIFIYRDKGLYAKCGFTIFAIINSFYGWYLWANGGPKKEGITVTRSSTKTLLLFFIIGLIATFTIGEIIKKYTNSEIAFWDAFYASFAVIAHWLMANKKIEAWIIWLVVDIVFANICLDKSLYILVIKSFFYTIISVYGYLEWRKSCIIEKNDDVLEKNN